MNLNHDRAATAERPKNQPLLGPSEVAEWLGVSSGWVRDHATRKDPRIRAIKIGKLLRFRSEDIEDFVRDSAESMSQI